MNGYSWFKKEVVMKLGEALTLRSKQGQKLNDLRQRIIANALVQEGQQAVENSNDLVEEFKTLSAEHADMVRRINKTNLNNGLIEMLVEREHLGRMRAVYDMAASEATPRRDSYRWMRTEVVFAPVITVETWRHTAEMYAEQLRVLDVQIQEKNWQIDLED